MTDKKDPRKAGANIFLHPHHSNIHEFSQLSLIWNTLRDCREEINKNPTPVNMCKAEIVSQHFERVMNEEFGE